MSAERRQVLQDIIDTYDSAIEATENTAAQDYFRAKQAEVQVELEGERGAAGLNPKTGEPA